MMTKNEQQELQLMQEILDRCPLIADELFHFKICPALASRYFHLREISYVNLHESFVADMAKQITDEIDKQIMKDLMEVNLSTATSPSSISKLKSLLNL